MLINESAYQHALAMNKGKTYSIEGGRMNAFDTSPVGYEAAKLSEQPDERTALAQDVEEYLHWRKVNAQIKGGENYLKRFRQSLAAPEREAQQPDELSALHALNAIEERVNHSPWPVQGRDEVWNMIYKRGWQEAMKCIYEIIEKAPMREAGDQLIRNLSMLVIRLAHRLNLREDGKALAAQAMVSCSAMTCKVRPCVKKSKDGGVEMTEIFFAIGWIVLFLICVWLLGFYSKLAWRLLKHGWDWL